MDELNNSDIIKEHSFVVSQIIGTGTFGRVILARQRYTQDHFAVKVLRICDICRLNQVEHIRSEKDILIENKHPFIVDLFWTSHDSTYLYMCLEFLPGGELFSYLRSRGHFENSVAQFYACEIILALEFLHYKHIIYRDLKPENLLLDLDGHVKLTDFGFAKKLEDSRTWTLCGTPEYIAPEVIQGKGHNKAVDWWSLGILLYEMLVGYPPFYDATPYGIYDKIVRGRIEWPQHRINKIAKDLIRKLLVQDRTRRLGNMKKGADDIKNHKWFQGVEWNHVYLKSEEPPIKPQVSHNGDSRNFEQYSDDGSLLFYESHSPPLTPEQKNLFNDF